MSGELSQPPELDTRTFRDVMGGFATGVAVVTTVTEDGYEGMTVNSLTALSLDPMLVLVCLTRDSRTLEAVEGRGSFVLNLLSRQQRDISNQFARPGEDHFDGVEIDVSEDGLPVLAGGLGYLICDVERTDDGGDHVIVIGRVRQGRGRPGDPLVFHRGRYGRYVPAARSTRDIAVDWFG